MSKSYLIFNIDTKISIYKIKFIENFSTEIHKNLPPINKGMPLTLVEISN